MSQVRQENFSRTVWITLYVRGTDSSVSVMLAQLAELAAAARAAGRRWRHHPLTRQMRRQRPTHRLGARERAHGGRAGSRLRRGGLILCGGGLHLLELHLELVQEFAAALGRGVEPVALEFGNEQLQVRHHRLGACNPGFQVPARRTLSQQRRLQRVHIIGQPVRRIAHIGIGSYAPVVMHAEFAAKDQKPGLIRPVQAARSAADAANRSPRACSQAALA
jgi:hypothetical protein